MRMTNKTCRIRPTVAHLLLISMLLVDLKLITQISAGVVIDVNEFLVSRNKSDSSTIEKTNNKLTNSISLVSKTSKKSNLSLPSSSSSKNATLSDQETSELY